MRRPLTSDPQTSWKKNPESKKPQEEPQRRIVLPGMDRGDINVTSTEHKFNNNKLTVIIYCFSFLKQSSFYNVPTAVLIKLRGLFNCRQHNRLYNCQFNHLLLVNIHALTSAYLLTSVSIYTNM